jgi:hypothetical protein
MYLSVKLGIWGLVLVVGQIEDFELLVSSLVYFFKFLDLFFFIFDLLLLFGFYL